MGKAAKQRVVTKGCFTRSLRIVATSFGITGACRASPPACQWRSSGGGHKNGTGSATCAGKVKWGVKNDFTLTTTCSRRKQGQKARHRSKSEQTCEQACACVCACACARVRRACACACARARPNGRAARRGGPAEDGSELRSHACGVAKVETRGRVPGVGRIVKWRKLEADSYNLVKLEHPKRLGEAVKGRPLQIPIQPPRLTEPAQCQRTEPHGVARPPFSVAALSLPCTGRAAGTPPPTNNGGLALCIC